MATPDNDTFKQLLKAIQEMNQNLEKATFAINNMTMQMNSSGAAGAKITVDPTLPCEVNGSKEAPKAIDLTYDTTATFGYINWDESHNVLKSHSLVKISVIRQSLKNLIKNVGKAALVQNNKKRAITHSYNEDYDDPVTVIGYFDFNNIVKPLVDKENRFPLDAVYVNVKSPEVEKEIKFMNEINVLPTDGVIDRFLRIVESERHTCATFEKKYGLLWV